MLKKILKTVVFLSNFILCMPSSESQNTTRHFMRMSINIPHLDSFLSGENKELFLKLSSFYSQKLQSIGIQTSIEQVFMALVDMQEHGLACGLNLEDLMLLWSNEMKKDLFGFGQTDLFVLLKQRCSNPNPGKEDIGNLSPEQIFKHKLAKYTEVSGGIKEDLFDYVWDKFVKLYDCADFSQKLHLETELLKHKNLRLPSEELPYFSHLVGIYKVATRLCYRLQEENDLPFSKVLDVLKIAEQKNARLGQSKLYSQPDFSVKGLQDHPGIPLFVKAVGEEVLIIKNQKFNDLKMFVAKKLGMDESVSEKSTLTQLRNRLQTEICKHKVLIKQQLVGLACDILFDIYEQNEQLMDKMLKNDLKNHQRVVLAVKKIKTTGDDDLRKRLIEEQVIEETVNSSGKPVMHMSMKGAPFLNQMLMIYDDLLFVFTKLQERKIVNNEESLCFIIKFLREENPKFSDFTSQQTNAEAMRDLLQNILSFCSVNTSDCFDQIRKEHVLKSQERKNREIVVNQEEEMFLAKLAEEKADLRRIAREKKRKEKELLKQQTVEVVKENPEICEEVKREDDFYCLNMNFFKTIEQAQKSRKSLPIADSSQEVIVCCDPVEQDENNDLLISQKVFLKNAKAQKRLMMKSSEFKVCSDEKHMRYNPELSRLIIESKLKGQSYDQQKELLHLEQQALEKKDELCADEYREQKLKKTLLNKLKMFFYAKRQLCEIQEAQDQQAKERADFLQHHGFRHNPYVIKVLESQSSSHDDIFENERATMEHQMVGCVRKNNPYSWAVLANK